MLRTFRINFKKNWVLPPSKWNQFFENLELDIEDLKEEIEDQVFNVTSFHDSNEDIIKKAGKYKRTKYPRL